MIETLKEISFKHPEFFYLALLLPFLITWYIFKNNKYTPSVSNATAFYFSDLNDNFLKYGRHIPFVLKMVALALLITGMARPQTSSSWEDVSTEGIDIVIAQDISASMLAEDFKPNRLKVSKKMAGKFIDNRPHDRIGLVVYEGESFTQCPLTTDHRVLKNLLRKIESGNLKSGTAIGMGIATAINRLKDSKAKSKVIILLTDGVNNRGKIAPKTAAKIAKEYGIRVYAIGVGSKGKARSPVSVYPNGNYKFRKVKVEIDEKSLKHIAELTGGKYFRATDKKKLNSIYNEIDRLEKSEIDVTKHSKKSEWFFPLALTGGILLLFSQLLKFTILKTAP
ncbi:MAG: VWA domain-containing protein [Flavobacteriales bacterium]